MGKNDGAWKSLGEFLRAQRRLANLSLRQLESLTTISNAYLSQVERGVYRPSAPVLKSIADALHLSVKALYARVGLLEDEEPRGEQTDVERAIRVDARITAGQKEALLRVYRSFLESVT
ncbi:MAG: hypothetical protein QOD06_3050 [Candidatus Binatota bacterium]|jgi:transcriptional regulator with XRE-family HTH domain|nr:hypothetical protein [Candidatus Binatota bacterium]